MTKDEILTNTLARLHRGSDSALLAHAQRELPGVQEKLELGVQVGGGNFLPWFLFTDKQDIAYTANEEAVALPSDFLQEYEEDHAGALFVYDATQTDPWVRLTREPWGIVKARYPGTATFPRFYDIVGQYIRVRPIPDTSGTMRMQYYARGTALSTAETNVWTQYAGELLINELGFLLASHHVRDKTAIQMFNDGMTREARRLYVAHIARLEAGRQRQRGDD